MTLTNDARRSPSLGAGWFALAGLFLVAAAVDDACRYYPAHLPYFMPWEFSWPTFLVTFVILGWFGRGLARTPPSERPPHWRSACFLLGILANLVVLQTHFELLAQHLFFANRVGQFVLHQLAPFLIALGASAGVLRYGLPDFLKPVAGVRAIRNVIDYLQHPVIAPLLFVGLIFFWLVPTIHTRTMLDSNLHDAMDWTVALNGILFWSLVMDMRPKPPARISYGTRILLIFLVLLPQIALGVVIGQSTADIYPIYTICGRILAMTALDDQHYGALTVLILPTVLSFVALTAQLICMRRDEARGRRARESA